MSVISEQSLGQIKYQYIDDLYPVHSAETGTVVFTKYGGTFSSVSPYDWCQYLKGNISGSMSSYGNTTPVSYTVGSWTNLNALTWVAGPLMSGFTLNGAQLTIDADKIGTVIITSSHTYEAGTARWANIEASLAINNVVPARYNGGTHDAIAGSETSFTSFRVVELDGKAGNYINVGNRQSAQQATTATSARKNHVVVAIEIDEPIKLIEKGTSLDFNTNGWVTVNDSTNKWVMGSATTFSGGGTSIYISNDNGVTNAYTNTVAQVSHFYKDFSFPKNLDSDILIAFNWRSQGEANDFGKMYLIPTSITPTVGVALSDSYSVGATKYNLQSTYTNTHTSTAFSGVTNMNVIKRETARGETVRLVFSWINDTSVGTNPPWAIDTFRLRYYPGRFVKPEYLFVSGFEGSSISGDGWTVVQSGVNAWTNGTGDFKPSISGSTKAAYISSNGTTPSYTNTVATTNHFYRDVVFPSNKRAILAFDWRCVGENAAAATAYDYGTVVIAATGTTPVAGTEVSTTMATTGGNGRIGAVANSGKFNTAYGGSNRWNYEEIELIAYAGQTKRLIFTWRNDNTGGSNPPMTIDNIRLTYEDL